MSSSNSPADYRTTAALALEQEKNVRLLLDRGIDPAPYRDDCKRVLEVVHKHALEMLETEHAMERVRELHAMKWTPEQILAFLKLQSSKNYYYNYY